MVVGEAITSYTMEAAIESSYLKFIAQDSVPDSRRYSHCFDNTSLSFLYLLHILHYTKFLIHEGMIILL